MLSILILFSGNVCISDVFDYNTVIQFTGGTSLGDNLQVPDDFYKAFGELLRKVRRNAPRRVTQAKLAAEVGLSRSSIANIERGRQRVPLHLLFDLAAVLRVPPSDLLPVAIAKGPRQEAVNAMRQEGIPASVIARVVPHLDEEGE